MPIALVMTREAPRQDRDNSTSGASRRRRPSRVGGGHDRGRPALDPAGAALRRQPPRRGGARERAPRRGLAGRRRSPWPGSGSSPRSTRRSAEGGVVRARLEWLPSLRPRLLAAHGRLRLDVRDAGHRHRRCWSCSTRATTCRPDDPVPRFFSFLLAFMGAMLGVVLSGNLIQLVFFWELTSLFSFLLIGYWHHNASGARRGARMALIVTGAGGLCLLAGVLVLGPHRRQLRPRRVSGRRRRDPRARPLPAGARADPARRADQERAVPVPLLAAARDGGADAGLGLPAFGDDGEGRRVPAGAAVAGAGGHRRLVLDRRPRGPRPRCCSAPTSRSSSTT